MVRLLPTAPLAHSDPTEHRRLIATRANRVGYFTYDAVGAVQQSIQDYLTNNVVSVRGFGALGDGVTDNHLAIQAAFDFAIANGGQVHFPAGDYLCSGRILWNESAEPSVAELTKVTVSGDGAGNTRINFTGTTTATSGFLFTGRSGANFATFVTIRDIQLVGTLTALTYGFFITNLVWTLFENVYINNFDYAIWARDMLSSNFHHCFFRLNNYGMRVAFEDAGQPNALNLTGCNFANKEYGLYILKPSTLAVTGGAFEGNGFTGNDSARWGVKIDDASSGGAAACTFNSVYFEKNDDVADVHIDQTANDATYTFIGCTFNRIDSTTFVTNNIKVSASSGVAKLNVYGCGFKGFGTYVESSARKYIAFSDAGADISFNEAGNHYDDALGDPTISTITTTPSAVDPLIKTTYISTSGSAMALSLADGHQDMKIFLLMTVDGGGTATLTPTSLGAGTTVAFANVDEFAVLEWKNTDWWMTAGTATLA